MTVDEDGNLYLAGNGFNGVLSDVPYIENTIFIHKYKSDSSLIWVRQLSASDNILGSYALRYDNQGNVILCGRHSGNLMCNGSLVAYGNDYETNFLLKIDSSGNFIWYKEVSEGVGIDAFETNSEGSSIIGLDAYSIYDSLLFNNDIVYGDYILASYNAGGELEWYKSYEGVRGDWEYDGLVTVDKNDNVILTAWVYLHTDIDGYILEQDTSITIDSTMGEPDTSTTYYQKCFVAKFNKSGEIQWLNELTNPRQYNYLNLFCPKTDADDNIYFLIQTDDSLFIDDTLHIVSENYNSYQILKLRSDGNFADVINHEDDYFIFSMEVFDKIYLMSVKYDSIILSEYDMTGNFMNKAVSYCHAGNIRNVLKFEANLFIGGSFSESGTIGTYSLSCAEDDDNLFFSKLKDVFVPVDNIQTFNLEVYPNPAAEVLHIENISLTDEITVAVYSSYGELYFLNRYNMNTGSISINTGIFLTGVIL